MSIRPVTPDRLVAEIVGLITVRRPGDWLRVAVDGAPPAGPDRLADALVDPVRAAGRPVLRVAAGDFLRPASVRWERGRTDPDAFYEDRLDVAGLRREVLAPLDAGGSGRVLPSLWDPTTDRATRAEYRTLAAGGVLLLSGTLLLGRGLPVDLTVHLWLSAPALARQLPEAERWTLPAYDRYATEVAPDRTADVVVRLDHADHPAILRWPPAG